MLGCKCFIESLIFPLDVANESIPSQQEIDDFVDEARPLMVKTLRGEDCELQRHYLSECVTVGERYGIQDRSHLIQYVLNYLDGL